MDHRSFCGKTHEGRSHLTMMRNATRLCFLLIFLSVLFQESGSLAQPLPKSPIETVINQKIDAKVLTDLRQLGQVTFFVVLTSQADTSPAATIADWGTRGQVVVDSLKEVADLSQQPILAHLA